MKFVDEVLVILKLANNVYNHRYKAKKVVLETV